MISPNVFVSTTSSITDSQTIVPEKKDIALAMDMIRGAAPEGAAFIDKYAAAYPEMNSYVGIVITSPEAPEGYGEETRTARSLEAFKWLLEGKYAEFTESQTVKLSNENFETLSRMFKYEYGSSPEKCDFMNSVMAIHDLGKIKSFQDKVKVASGSSNLVNHDEILLTAMHLVEKGDKTIAELLPSYCKLSDEKRELIRQGWEMGLNKGQLIQGENTPANLKGVLAVREKNLEAVQLFFHHEILDMSGLVPSNNGCFLYNQDLYKADQFAIEAVLDKTLTTEEEIYSAYLEKRAEWVGFSIYNQNREIDPRLYAAARMICTLRIFNKAQAADVIHYFTSSSASPSLIEELNTTGCKGDKKALLIYYSPAICSNLIVNKDLNAVSYTEKMVAAFTLLDKIYQAGRDSLEDLEGKGVSEISCVHISNEVKKAKSIEEINGFAISVNSTNGIAAIVSK